MDRRNAVPLVVAVVVGLALALWLWLWLDWPLLLAWLVGWTPPAFAAYGYDKMQARRGGWRIPENVLHGLALVGGVAGAWAGRIVFRHKTRKPVFLVVLVVATALWAGLAIWAVLNR
jgi:uncharacterized membrane protein YsdA (DUF1294 family)